MGDHKLEKPVKIDKLVTEGHPAWKAKLLFGGSCGDMVAVRPCAKEYGDKTFLGILIGEIAQGVSMGVRASDNALVYDMGYHNPAIFVPDLNTLIFGSGSWWGRLRDVQQLREITDEDINNVWYVRALRQLEAAASEEAAEAE